MIVQAIGAYKTVGSQPLATSFGKAESSKFKRDNEVKLKLVGAALYPDIDWTCVAIDLKDRLDGLIFISVITALKYFGSKLAR